MVLEPGQELARLGHVAWVGDRWRAGLELLRELERALAHLGPVLHRRADLADHPAQVPLDLLQLVGRGVASDLGVDHRLCHGVLGQGVARQHLEQPAVRVAPHAHDRVDDQVDPEVLAVELHRDGVD